MKSLNVLVTVLLMTVTLLFASFMFKPQALDKKLELIEPIELEVLISYESESGGIKYFPTER